MNIMLPLSGSSVHAVFYPFHLCHENTLTRLLNDYDAVHFKNFLSIQLTPLVGTTAFEDRMGDYYPQDLASRRIIQGYDVSGPLSPAMTRLIDEDLHDPTWRKIFHLSFEQDLRFQEGLFGKSNTQTLGKDRLTRPEYFRDMKEPTWEQHDFSVAKIQQLSKIPPTSAVQYEFDYGFSLFKTSASLAYTRQLACQFSLQPVTDSFSHFLLLHHTIRREEYALENTYFFRQNY